MEDVNWIWDVWELSLLSFSIFKNKSKPAIKNTIKKDDHVLEEQKEQGKWIVREFGDGHVYAAIFKMDKLQQGPTV